MKAELPVFLCAIKAVVIHTVCVAPVPCSPCLWRSESGFEDRISRPLGSYGLPGRLVQRPGQLAA